MVQVVYLYLEYVQNGYYLMIFIKENKVNYFVKLLIK
jgi:hypothetical protein